MRVRFAPLTMLLCVGLGLYGCNQLRSARTPVGPKLAMAAGPTVGQAAPEIDGVDIEGVRFKLSNYRGKVVVLDFWGNW
jgi:AhpC/TSA family